MNNKSKNLWGIDLGGTKVEGVVLKSASEPEVLFRDRLPTEASKGYQHVIGQISKVVDLMEKNSGYRPDKIGIGSPGTLDPHTGKMKNSNSTALNQQPMLHDLEATLKMKVRMANDANCFALAEASMGVVKQKQIKAEVVFGVIMGTGVGGGVVVNGKVINGLQGIGGEWGHNFLDASGGDCYCGKKGCVEKVLSGPALERYYHNISGLNKNMKEIVANADKDVYAKHTIERLIHFFGLGLSVVVNILDPDVIVLGGGVGNIDALYTDGVASLKKHVFNNRLDTKVLRPSLGDSAGVFGAAFLNV
jgi:fructokinase